MRLVNAIGTLGMTWMYELAGATTIVALYMVFCLFAGMLTDHGLDGLSAGWVFSVILGISASSMSRCVNCWFTESEMSTYF